MKITSQRLVIAIGILLALEGLVIIWLLIWFFLMPQSKAVLPAVVATPIFIPTPTLTITPSATRLVVPVITTREYLDGFSKEECAVFPETGLLRCVKPTSTATPLGWELTPPVWGDNPQPLEGFDGPEHQCRLEQTRIVCEDVTTGWFCQLNRAGEYYCADGGAFVKTCFETQHGVTCTSAQDYQRPIALTAFPPHIPTPPPISFPTPIPSSSTN